MTSKELFYVEDALGHEQYFMAQCSETMNKLQDPELRSLVQQLQQSHRTLFQNFYGLL